MPGMLLIPKFVRIRNTRLNFLYHMLVFLTVAGYSSWFVYQRRYNEELDISHAIDVSAWPFGHGRKDLPKLLAEWDRVHNSTPCLNFSRVFFSTATEQYDYGIATCKPPCTSPEQLQQYDCVALTDLVTVESATSMFWPTMFIEEGYHKTNLTSTLVPFERNLGVEFSYNYLVESSPVWDFFGLVNDFQIANSKTDILTVVMKEGKVAKVIQPQNTIVLTLDEIMELAGVPGILDLDNSLAKTKQDPNGPVARATGVEFEIQIKCYNRHHFKNNDAEKGLNATQSMAKHICLLLVVRSRRSWVYLEEKLVGENSNHTLTSLAGSSYVVRRYHGIRVTFRTEGSWEFMNFMNFFDALIQILVMVKLPMVAVRFVATNTLGSLSRIYSRVIDEPFAIREQVGGLATRMMTNSVTYLDLTDQKDAEGKWGISINRMRERLGACLSSQKDLDENEIWAMTQFCYESVMEWQLSRKSEAQALADIISTFTHAKKKALTDDTRDEPVGMKLITEEEYGEALTNSEKLGFHDIVDLFDGDRKMTLMECIFSPKYLTNLHKSAQAETFRLRKSRKGDAADDDDDDGDSDANQKRKYGKALTGLKHFIAKGGKTRDFAGTASVSGRRTSVESQKNELRRNAGRLQALEETSSSIQERLDQVDRRYWEIREAIAEQDKAIAALSNGENAKSNEPEHKQTAHSLPIEKRLRAELECTMNTRLIEMESQLDARVKTDFSSLQMQLEALVSRVEEIIAKTEFRRLGLDAGLGATGGKRGKGCLRPGQSHGLGSPSEGESFHHRYRSAAVCNVAPSTVDCLRGRPLRSHSAEAGPALMSAAFTSGDGARLGASATPPIANRPTEEKLQLEDRTPKHPSAASTELQPSLLNAKSTSEETPCDADGNLRWIF